MLAHLADVASRCLPALASGTACHRRALAAAARGDRAAAERWFGRAIARYRRDLAVEPLARLRVHELMVGARPGGGEPATDASDAMVEIVRRLNRLDQLETLDFPHELADARSVLAGWVETHAVPAPATGTVRAASSAAA
jgi:hypothetical protein